MPPRTQLPEGFEVVGPQPGLPPEVTDVQPTPQVEIEVGSPTIPEGFELVEKPVAKPVRLERLLTNTATKVGKMISSLVPDASRMEPQDVDLPEIGGLGASMRPFTGQGAREALQIGAGLFTTTDEEKQAEIIKSAVPGTRFRKDRFGNVLVKFPEGSKWEFLNKPGFSLQDFLQAAGQVTTFLPAGLAATGIPGVMGRIFTGFAANVGTSALQDIAADMLTEEGADFDSVDARKAGIVGFFGALGEVTSVATARLVRRLQQATGLSRGFTDDEIRAIAEAAGLDATDMSPKFIDAVRRVARDTPKDELNQVLNGMGFKREATESISQGEILGSKFDVPLTRGQATGDFTQIAREEAMRSDALGEGAGRIMRRFDETQGEALERAAERVVTRQGPEGAPVPGDVGEALGITREGLISRNREARQAVQESFEALEDQALRTSARFSGEGFLRFKQHVRSVLDESGFEVDPDLAPFVNRALNQIDEIGNDVISPSQLRETPGFLSRQTPQEIIQSPDLFNPVTFKRIRTLRRKLERWRQSTKNTDPQQAEALRVIKKNLDDFIFNAADNGLMSGDPRILDMFRKANQARTKLGELFEKRGRFDDVGFLIERITKGEGITNREVGNWLLGASKVGQSGRALRFVKRAERIFGRDSPEFASIRQGAVRQLFWGNRGAGEVLLSSRRILTNLNDYLSGPAKEYAEFLHTSAQLAELRNLRSLVKRLVPPHKATNPSGSAFTIARLIQESFGKLAAMVGFQTGGPLAGIAAERATTMLGRARGTARALSARRGGMPALPPPSVSPIFATAGSVMKAEDALNDPNNP